MTQIPPQQPPYAPQSMPPQTGGYTMQPTATNGWGIASLVTGLAGFCSLGIGGLLALVFGILGIRRSKITRTGKGMSIAGIILGLVSMAMWAVFSTAIFAAIGLGVKSVQVCQATTTQMLTDLGNGDLDSAVSRTQGITKTELEPMGELVKELGALKGTKYNSFNIVNNRMELGGTATFEKGERAFSAQLTGSGSTWKVTHIELK